MLWEYIDKDSYTHYIKNVITDDMSAIKYLALSVVTWRSNGVVTEFECQKSYLEFLDVENAIAIIERARLIEDFWSTEKNIPEYMAAFVLLEGDANLTVDADKVKEKIKVWKEELNRDQSLKLIK